MKPICIFLIPFISLFFCLPVYAQPGAEIELAKPEKYENRKLASEKTGERKFTFPRRVYQNTVTHYNYFFNANNRLNDLVVAAKSSFRDDYSQLLPFYNYTLEATSSNKQELDSIIYKATAGILLHDLRNNWIDNLYLILAKAYFYRNDLDSAALTLQYLNFSFAPKEEDNYDIPIGSSASNESGVFSIATKEKPTLLKKLTGKPPSRNESFLWQVRTHIERNELAEAAGIIEILRHDPNFPARLKNGLNESLAYWFYKQQVYDSSAFYLSRSLPQAANGQEEARWEYLIAQMYQLSDGAEQAVEFYNRSISHTTDPVMDVYARLNAITINRANTQYLQQNIDALLKMARRDKFEAYRDIIYYAAATMELQRQNTANAQEDLLKSVKYNTNNPAQRSQSFVLLGDINFNTRAYPASYNFYDSADINALPSAAERERIEARKPPLQIIAKNTLVILREDSLQALANLPADQRDAIIKKQLKILRKAQGIKEEPAESVNPAVKPADDLFQENTAKGNQFYFYNASAKARGFSEFKARFGERPNVDNWARKSALDKKIDNLEDVQDAVDSSNPGEQGPVELSYEGLQQRIPLTQDKLNASNQAIMQALFENAQTFFLKLEEYPAAIEAYEELLRRFPGSPNRQEAMFNLAYAYGKTGNMAKAQQYRSYLLADTTDNKWTTLLKNPDHDKIEALAATKKYEDIYDMFIEGRFAEAKLEKAKADSMYGNTYWTPQLLFIESIYYIKQQDDSTAIRVLTNLTDLYKDNVMAEKANMMIDVLHHRKEIEAYLTNLKVSRNEDKEPVATIVPEIKMPEPEQADTLALRPRKAGNTAVKDKKDASLAVTPKMTTPGKPSTVVVTDTTKAIQLPVEEPVIQQPDTVQTDQPDTVESVEDSVPPPPAPVVKFKNFSFVPADPHYVVIVLDKVDPVYASEAKNAFNRFNRDRYYNQKIEMESLKLDDRFSLVLEGPFTNAAAATEYIDKVAPVTRSRILPWLSPSKYSFILISNKNLDVLKADKDMDSYRQLLKQAFPDKF